MTAPSTQSATFTLRSIAPSVFLPALVYEIGNGAIAPVVALTALDLGASPGAAGYTLALLGLGQILGDVPSSAVAERFGDRRAMLMAAGVACIAVLGCLLAPTVLVLGLALLVLGMANATFYLARQSYLSEVVPVRLRARAMSSLGGSHRIGLFIGPFLGAAAISVAGLRAAYVLAMGTAIAAAVLLLVIRDADRADDRPPATRGGVSAWAMFTARRRLFATLGLAVLAFGAVRATRQTVLPLWAEHIGMSAETTSLVFGVASAVDMALFYPAGRVMDRSGRLAVALPAVLIMAVSMMALPLTHGVASLTIVAMVMSFGNGIGSGIIMTLGADVAPADSRIRFLSIWRIMSDSGNAAGPVVVSVVASASMLAAGIMAIGPVGVFAAIGFVLWAPKYSPYATRASVRERERDRSDA